MEQRHRVQARVQGRLPFSLNVPADTYLIMVDGTRFEMEVSQRDHLVLANTGDGLDWLVVSEDRYEELKAANPELQKLPPLILPTGLSILYTIDLVASQIPPIDDEQGVAEVIQELIVSRSTDLSGEALEDEAKRVYFSLEDRERSARRDRGWRRALVRGAFKEDLIGHFVKASNRLVQHYMLVTKDPFVEEVSVHQLNSGLIGKLRIFYYLDGEFVETVGHGPYASYIQPGPWFQHPDETIGKFRSRLLDEEEPDYVRLLLRRSASLARRGRFRLATVEACVAGELALEGRLTHELRRRNVRWSLVEQLLSRSRGFEDRARGLFKAATGTSMPEQHPSLWREVLETRKIRNRVVHRGRRVSEKEALEAVNVMERFVDMVSGEEPWRS